MGGLKGIKILPVVCGAGEKVAPMESVHVFLYIWCEGAVDVVMQMTSKNNQHRIFRPFGVSVFGCESQTESNFL